MNLFLREWLNAALIPVNVCIILIITHQLYKARQRYGKDWTREGGVASACAFWWIFVSELIRSVLAWTYLYQQRTGTFNNDVNAPVVVLFVVSSLIALPATFRLVYTLSPDEWGHKSWVASAASTAAFLLILYVFF